jgi:hypothetical protein
MFSRRLAWLLVMVLIVTTWLFVGIWRRSDIAVHNGDGLRLQPPAFVNTAYADSGNIGARLDEEAGISAYFNAGQTITLSRVRGQFRTIETETADYILGSVAVPNYIEHFDAHVYVHRTGWILAYYLRPDPVSKIIDPKARSITTTKLANVLAAVGGVAGVPVPEVVHYDFRYPNATHMMLVAEDDNAGDDFTVQIPSSFAYFERSWATQTSNCCGYYFTVNGINKPNVVFDSDSPYGIITASQLLPDTTHRITAGPWGVLVIVYRVP